RSHDSCLLAASCMSFFVSSRRRHTRFSRDWSSDVCSSDLEQNKISGFNRAVSQSGSVFELLSQMRKRTVFKYEIAHGRQIKSLRSEERRVGKEGRARRPADESENKRESEVEQDYEVNAACR